MLFRREAVDARRGSWLGEISLAQPIRSWILPTAAAAVATLIILFLTLATYTRRSHVAGQLVPKGGMAHIVSPATGVVTEMKVLEGDKVSQAQVLLTVSVPRATAGSGDTQAALAERLQERETGLESAREAQEQQLAVQTSGLSDQISIAQNELANINAEIATRSDQVKLARETLERLRLLEKSGYASGMQIREQQSAALDQQATMQNLQRQAIATRRSISQLKQALVELPQKRKAVIATFENEKAQLDQERVETEARAALTVSSPVTGVVAAQMVKLGQSVQAGQPLLSVLPGSGELQAELLVPSRAIGFIEPGDRVRLRYPAYPYQKFGHHEGKVAALSRSTLGTNDAGTTNLANQSEPVYRVTVQLAEQAVIAYGKAEPLRPGMLIDADILGEERRLIEWVFEPLYSLRGNVKG